MFPTVFLSHGSPTIAVEPGEPSAVWRSVAAQFEKPKAIVVVSAHWETRHLAVTGASRPETIHDFSGFPRALYQIDYPVEGSPRLAARIVELLKEAALPAEIDNNRGLDHGAWIPLLQMYPQGDVPVVQLSLQTGMDARHQFLVGQALARLRKDSVLILGSGGLTHNLLEVQWTAAENAAVPVYIRDFQSWVANALEERKIDDLLRYRSVAPHAVRVHPTEEHFLPLFAALGAAGSEAQIRRQYNGVSLGVLAMDVYTFN